MFSVVAVPTRDRTLCCRKMMESRRRRRPSCLSVCLDFVNGYKEAELLRRHKWSHLSSQTSVGGAADLTCFQVTSGVWTNRRRVGWETAPSSPPETTWWWCNGCQHDVITLREEAEERNRTQQLDRSCRRPCSQSSSWRSGVLRLCVSWIF